VRRPYLPPVTQCGIVGHTQFRGYREEQMSSARILREPKPLRRHLAAAGDDEMLLPSTRPSRLLVACGGSLCIQDGSQK